MSDTMPMPALSYTIMRRLITLSVLAYIAHSSAAERRTVCKTPAVESSCSSVHGRLQFGNGTPALRLWQIGATHEFGIFSGPKAEDLDPGDNEHPHLPRSLAAILYGSQPFAATIYADFEVCPLERHIPGHMQAACIESATHLVVDKY